MSKIDSKWVYGVCGALVTIGQALLLRHDLIDGKPYKVVDPLDVFSHTLYVGVPTSLILCGFLLYLMRARIVEYLLPTVPVLAFPVFVWCSYQVLFAWSGLDFFSGSGDFTPRQNEMEFAKDIIEILIIGCLGALISAALATIMLKAIQKVFGKAEG